MRRVSPPHKARAQSDSDRSTSLALVASFLGVAVGGGVGLAVPPVGVGVAVAFAAWAAALQRHAIVMQRVVRDPPDPDYRSSTAVSGRRFDIEPLLEDDFGRVSAPALEALMRTSSLTAAMVRALERSQGAVLAGQQQFEVARFDEAVDFARQSAEELQRFVDSTGQVVDAVRRLPDMPQRLLRGGRLLGLLDSDALAELYQMGVPRADLDIPVQERVNEDPRQLFAREMNGLADVSGGYAGSLLRSPSTTFTDY